MDRRRVAGVVVGVGVAACGHRHDAAAAWTQILSRCALDETLQRRRIVFLGPSNQVGPGSLWRSVPGGALHLRRLASELAGPRVEDAVVLAGAPSTCAGRVEVSVRALGGLLADLGAVGLAGGVGGSGGRASRAEASVDAWAKDVLLEGRFEDLFALSDPGGPYRRDALRPRRLLMTRAIRVVGFGFDLSREAALALGLDVRASGPAPLDVGGLAFRIDHGEEGSVAVRSETPFYVVGELLPVRRVLSVEAPAGSPADALDITPPRLGIDRLATGPW